VPVNRVVRLVIAGLLTAGIAATATSAAGTRSSASSPITIATSFPVNTTLQNFEEVGSGAKAAVDAINRAGGIKGHKINLVTCDNQNDANQSVACARQAIGANPAAIIRWASNTYGSLEAPLFQQAKIPVFDNQGNPGDLVNPIGWGINAGPAANQLATPFAFKKLGLKSAVFFTRDFPAATAGYPVFATACKNAGIKNLGIVAFPTGTTDYSPYAFKIKNLGADAVWMNTAFAQSIGIMKAAAQIGLKPTWAINGGNVTDVGLTQLPDQGNGLLLANPTPSWRDAKLAGVKRFNTEMTKAGFAADDTRHRGGYAMASWLDVYAFANVAKQIKGPITSSTVLRQLSLSKPIDLFGLTTFAPKKKGPASFPRMFGSRVYFAVARNGTIVPEPKLAPVDGLKANHLR
jgi:branched-chain amino acid transport system substrate-binding protein